MTNDRTRWYRLSLSPSTMLCSVIVVFIIVHVCVCVSSSLSSSQSPPMLMPSFLIVSSLLSQHSLVRVNSPNSSTNLVRVNSSNSSIASSTIPTSHHSRHNRCHPPVAACLCIRRCRRCYHRRHLVDVLSLFLSSRLPPCACCSRVMAISTRVCVLPSSLAPPSSVPGVL